MYKFIQAEPKYLDQITPLLLRTGYWEVDLKYNTLQLSSYDFMKEFIAKPYLPFTTIVIDEEEESRVVGAVVCSSKSELETLSSAWIEKLDPKVIALFKNLINFEISNSFHISCISILKEKYGSGLGHLLLKYVEKKGLEQGYDTLSLYTVSCQTNAIRLYLSFGMMITKVITLDERLPFPYVLYFEKNKLTSELHNYFDSDIYKNLDLKELVSHEKD